MGDAQYVSTARPAQACGASKVMPTSLVGDIRGRRAARPDHSIVRDLIDAQSGGAHRVDQSPDARGRAAPLRGFGSGVRRGEETLEADCERHGTVAVLRPREVSPQR